jgi:peptidoglycan/LPS O-acetylase OafA/YrhL
MDDIKTVIVYAVGAIATLLAPIQNFMYAMLILFGVNFLIGLLAARMKEEKWSTKKALMFFVYVAIFLLIACMSFIIGHLMGEHEQAIAVVKILCYIAVYIFGTNIFRNLRKIVPKGTAWYRLFDLCYYTLSVKFIEKFAFVKKWREESKENSSNTILDHDNF